MQAHPTARGDRNSGVRSPAVNAIAAAVAGILYGASGGAYAQAVQPVNVSTDTATSDEATLDTIVVTGTTGKDRTIPLAGSSIPGISSVICTEMPA